jgi:hypothetical protein
MAKLETADQFIEQVKNGKYETKVNAQRAAGRTRLSDGEKKKAFAFLDKHFGVDAAPASTTPKTSKRLAKVSRKKKVTRPKKTTPSEVAVTEPAAAAASKPAKTAKKVVTKTRKAPVEAAPEGTLPISPSEVNSVADVLKLIDSTVSQSVSIVGALRTANDLHEAGDIATGVSTIKLALVGAAQLLHQNVVAPLNRAGTQADAEVAQRLQEVINASVDGPAQQNASVQHAGYVPPPPAFESQLS